MCVTNGDCLGVIPCQEKHGQSPSWMGADPNAKPTGSQRKATVLGIDKGMGVSLQSRGMPRIRGDKDLVTAEFGIARGL